MWPVIFCQHFLTSVCLFFAGFSSGRISGLSANLTQSSEVSRSSVAAIATPSRQRRTGSRRGRRLKLFRKTTFLVNDQELGAGNMGYQVFKRGIQNLYIFLAKNQHYFKEMGRILSTDVVQSCQKVPKSDLQSQFSMSKINRFVKKIYFSF